MKRARESIAVHIVNKNFLSKRKIKIILILRKLSCNVCQVILQYCISYFCEHGHENNLEAISSQPRSLTASQPRSLAASQPRILRLYVPGSSKSGHFSMKGQKSKRNCFKEQKSGAFRKCCLIKMATRRY